MRVRLRTPEDRSERYLDLDQEREVVRLIGSQEEPLGTMSWDRLISLLLTPAVEAAGREKRSCPRAPVALRIACRAPEQEEFVSVTRDIGPGGAFIETATPFPPGTDLSLDFVLPDPPFEHVRAKARVAWVREMAERYFLLPGMGVQFVEIDLQARTVIRDLVRALNQSRGSTDVTTPGE